MTCYFTLRAWMAMGINTLRRNTTMRMLTHGIIWGGFEGMAVPIFVADIILVLVTVGAIVSIEPGVILVGWFVAATVAFFGGIVGAMVGGVLGLAAAVVAIPIVLISRTLVSAR